MLLAMFRSAATAVSCGAAFALTGCSIVGARVPDKPPAPKHCPAGVIVSDIIGSVLTMGSAVRIAYTLFIDQSDAGSHDDVVLPFVLPVMGLLAVTFVSSTVYGLRERSRCKRMKDAADAEERAADAAAANAVRADVVGDRPLFCLDAAGGGGCYVDEPSCAVAAAHQGGACEARAQAWCFDYRGIADARTQTICSVSPAQCDERRMRVAADRTNIVSTCGTYRMRP